MSLFNVGKGLALNIIVRAKIAYYVTYDAEHSAYVGFKFEPFINISASVEFNIYEFEIVVSALEEGSNSQHFEDAGLRRLKIQRGGFHFDELTIEYDDMFGNPYKTRYKKGSGPAFEWIPPGALSLRSGILPTPPPRSSRT